MKQQAFLLGFLLLLGRTGATQEAAAPGTPPPAVAAKVAVVVDSQTVLVMADGRPWRIRLAGVGLPHELGSKPAGAQGADPARQYLKSLIEGRAVLVAPRTNQAGEPTPSFLYRISDRLDVSRELIAQGYAVADREWAGSRFSEFQTLEKTARTEPRGLWKIAADQSTFAALAASLPRPAAPVADPVVGAFATDAAPAASPEALPSPRRLVPQPELKPTSLTVKTGVEATDPAVYVTPNGSKYHRADCSSLARSEPLEVVRSVAARDHGPCLRCRPDEGVLADKAAGAAAPLLGTQAQTPQRAGHPCGANTRAGSPCKRWVVKGTHCYQHGG